MLRKEKLDKLILPLIIILVAISAFALGRISGLNELKPELKILQNDQAL